MQNAWFCIIHNKSQQSTGPAYDVDMIR